jgi:hypothetical protein
MKHHMPHLSPQDPLFTVVRQKDASGWYVQVSWQDGRRPEQITGFSSDKAAEAWIAEESPIWARKRRLESGNDRNGLEQALDEEKTDP